MADRLAQALDRPIGRAPVVDILAPPLAVAPDDTLASLIPGEHPSRTYTDAQRTLLQAHAKAKRSKTMHEAQAKALVRPIATMLEEIIEMKAAEGIATGEWDALADDDPSFRLQPYEHRRIWPRYREDPETDQAFTVADVCTALRDAGYGEIITERPDDQAYNKLVADRVKRWRRLLGDDKPGHKVDGVFVDLDGSPLIGHELEDPTADILALPRVLRRVIEPMEQLDVRYRRTDNPDAPAADAAADAEQAEHPADG